MKKAEMTIVVSVMTRMVIIGGERWQIGQWRRPKRSSAS